MGPDEFLSPPEPNPQGKRYPDFLADEVIPLIEERYRTLPGPANRILGGSSYGALINLYAASVRPGLAHSLLLESPSLYVDNGRLFAELTASDTPLRKVYIGVGTNELGRPDCGDHPDNREAVADAKRLQRLLLERKMREEDVLLVIDPCATHSEAAWAERFGPAIRFLTDSAKRVK